MCRALKHPRNMGLNHNLLNSMFFIPVMTIYLIIPLYLSICKTPYSHLVLAASLTCLNVVCSHCCDLRYHLSPPDIIFIYFNDKNYMCGTMLWCFWEMCGNGKFHVILFLKKYSVNFQGLWINFLLFYHFTIRHAVCGFFFLSKITKIFLFLLFGSRYFIGLMK